jgi:hypothetical protein
MPVSVSMDTDYAALQRAPIPSALPEDRGGPLQEGEPPSVQTIPAGWVYRAGRGLTGWVSSRGHRECGL